MTDHPANGLDDVVHQRVRLGIMAIGTIMAMRTRPARYLGQHLTVLEKAELIQIEKGYEGKRPRTWVTLTAAGQAALRDQIAHLKRLIQQVEQAKTSPTADR